MNATAYKLKLRLGALDISNADKIKTIERIDYNIQNLLDEITRVVNQSGENIRDIPIDYLAEVIDLDSYIDSILHDYKYLETRMRVTATYLEELTKIVE